MSTYYTIKIFKHFTSSSQKSVIDGKGEITKLKAPVHTGQIQPYIWLKDGGLWTTLEGGKLWKNSRSKQKTEICWADFE